MRAIVLLGAPGAGKGTMAEVIARNTPFVQVSTGNILREAVRRGTAEGLHAKHFMDTGLLVPDEVIIELVRARLETDRGAGDYMFDGFPRTVNQAELLEGLLEKSYQSKLERVFFLEVTQDVVVARLSGRQVCSSCEAVYHKLNCPPKKEKVCDRCGGALYQRKDDMQETILQRLEVFENQIRDLIRYYEERGLLCRVNASVPSEEVAREVLQMLGAV